MPWTHLFERRQFLYVALLVLALVLTAVAATALALADADLRLVRPVVGAVSGWMWE